MVGLPVTIRLLDPPLHEFLPSLEETTDERLARADQGAARGEPDARDARLPARPAVAGDLRDAGARDRPRRRSPSARRTGRGAAASRSCTRSSPSRRSCGGCASSPAASRPRRDPTSRYLVGTMIELPRACVRADEIAQHAQILLLRHERPDADGARLLARRRRGQVPHPLPRGRRARDDPFATLDQDGVGELMRTAVERGRAAKRRSRSASAASTAATLRRSRSATTSGSTTSPARPTGCRSPASPRRRRCWRRPVPARYVVAGG